MSNAAVERARNEALRIMGMRLRAAREAQGLRLVDVALSARISVPFLSDIERGNGGTSFLTMVHIARAVDVSLDDLTEGLSL